MYVCMYIYIYILETIQKTKKPQWVWISYLSSMDIISSCLCYSHIYIYICIYVYILFWLFVVVLFYCEGRGGLGRHCFSANDLILKVQGSLFNEVIVGESTVRSPYKQYMQFQTKHDWTSLGWIWFYPRHANKQTCVYIYPRHMYITRHCI